MAVRQGGRRVWPREDVFAGCTVHKIGKWWKWGWKGKWRLACAKVCLESSRASSLTCAMCLIGVNDGEDLSLSFNSDESTEPATRNSPRHTTLSPLAKLLIPLLLFKLGPADSPDSCSTWLLPTCLTSSPSVPPSCTPAPPLLGCHLTLCAWHGSAYSCALDPSDSAQNPTSALEPLCCTPPGLTLAPSEMCSLCLPRRLKPTSTGREPHTLFVLLYQEKVGQPEVAQQRRGVCCALRKHLGLSPEGC